MKVRVPVYGTVGKAVDIERNPVTQAQLAAAIAGVQVTAAPPSGAAATLWRLIREVPANVVKLAALTTSGLITRTAAGNLVARSIAVASTSRLTVADAAGDAGDPTLDMADIAAVSVWGRAANTSGKPAVISAAANDRLVARTADQITFRQLTVGMVPDGELTYAKIQDVSAASKLLGRGDGGSGDVQEITLGTNLTMSGTTLNATGGSSGGGNVTPDTHPSSPNAADDEFETGATIDTAGTRFTGATPWAWRNQGTATAVVTQGALIISAAAAATESQKVVEQAAPAGNFIYRAKIAGRLSADNFPGAGMVLYRNTGTKFIVFRAEYNSGFKHGVHRFNAAVFASSIYGPTFDTELFGGSNRWSYYEIEHSGTNYIFRLSATGVDGSFVTLATEAQATFLGGVADTIGLFVSSTNAANPASIVCDWFRRVA